MAHLIDKNVLVDYIKEKRDSALMRQQNLENIGQETVHNKMVADELSRLLSFIDTIKTEYSDFEKEFDRIWFDNRFGEYFYNDASNFAKIRILCEHFYELGLLQKKE